jgi:hypothetical protein
MVSRRASNEPSLKTGCHGPQEGPFIVLFIRFLKISRNTWEVSTPTKPIATVTRRAGRCSAANTADTLNREELAVLLDCMVEKEAPIT